jgi:hypothetical protein
MDESEFLRAVMRTSVSNFATTDADVDASLAAILAASGVDVDS